MSLTKIRFWCLALLMNLQNSYAQEQKIKSSLFSSAVGDALGRVTEFITPSHSSPALKSRGG